MNPFEDDGEDEGDVYLDGDEGEILSTIIPNMERGDVVMLHEIDCPAWGDGRCKCIPMAIYGPSGKA